MRGIHLATAAVRLLLVLTLLTGVLYPLAITGIARLLFPGQAAGSLVQRHGQIVGSRLIGQSFSDARYFWGRPSATVAVPYDASASYGSNLGPTNPTLLARVQVRLDALHAADPQNGAPVPVDLVTASASGLDPDISPAAARYQAGRVARARGLSETAVLELIAHHTRPPVLGVLGEPRVNVLELNLALDELP